ncbi:hypothetical protein [Flavobacterium gyeonganense]|uniref:Uncharacterized protein n=1 Tax=Flavobacterium gyeonganense TaxID=1310418 RepID=A0ABV5H6S7_9FLAO|nr:hypothetical protein [Flavobacterium gyeonganense]
MRKSIMKNVLLQESATARESLKIVYTILLLALSALIFSACSNDEGGGNTSDYYFKATVDGREINYHSAKFQGDGGTDNIWEHVVVGAHETSYTFNGPLPPSLDFEIWYNGGNIEPGDYISPTDGRLIVRYAIQTSEGTNVYNTSWHDLPFKVTIEAISKEGIKGTMAGTLQNQQGETRIITNGSFNLPYDQLVNP